MHSSAHLVFVCDEAARTGVTGVMPDMVLDFCWTVLHTSHHGWNKAQDSMARITSGRSRSRSGDLLRLQMDEGEHMDGWRLQVAFELLFKVVENQLHMPMGQTPQCRPFTMPSLYLCADGNKVGEPTDLTSHKWFRNKCSNARRKATTRGSLGRCGPSSRFRMIELLTNVSTI